MTRAILHELELRAAYLEGHTIETIYFGGGTPSILPIDEIALLSEAVFKLFEIAPNPEITLEANPDDMDGNWAALLRDHTPVNRLSIGVQSFHDADLLWMNRAHKSGQARHCIEAALKHGFSNLNIDLIYGSPTTPDEAWAENLRIVFEYGVPHISCYALTVEEGTALHSFVKKGKSAPVDEARAARQFEYLMETAPKAGFEQYEISNFAQPGQHARHNSSYWLGEHYLGLGPSAHSFNGVSRQWNVANNALYLNALAQGGQFAEIEALTPENRFNEYVMTMLRTHWGCELGVMRNMHPLGAQQFEESAERMMGEGLMDFRDGTYRLTVSGRLLADRVASDLFVL